MVAQKEGKGYTVLIESDWNLKGTVSPVSSSTFSVLIESDWNLKLDDLLETSEGILVLIEWRSHCYHWTFRCGVRGYPGINRIRLEFKASVDLYLKLIQI